jgi:hypothetical protein
MDKAPALYDAFLVNGHFGCVVHVSEYVVLVRVWADNMTYAMRPAFVAALIEAFSTMPFGDMRA